jgi:DNA-binding MarR family transcriptional regulator
MTTHLTNVFQFARRHNLSLSAMWALLVLRDQPDTAITQVGDAVGISSAAITGVVDTLAEAGLVERTHGLKDRRKVFLRLTEKALELLSTSNI